MMILFGLTTRHPLSSTQSATGRNLSLAPLHARSQHVAARSPRRRLFHGMAREADATGERGALWEDVTARLFERLPGPGALFARQDPDGFRGDRAMTAPGLDIALMDTNCGVAARARSLDRRRGANLPPHLGSALAELALIALHAAESQQDPCFFLTASSALWRDCALHPLLHAFLVVCLALAALLACLMHGLRPGPDLQAHWALGDSSRKLPPLILGPLVEDFCDNFCAADSLPALVAEVAAHVTHLERVAEIYQQPENFNRGAFALGALKPGDRSGGAEELKATTQAFVGPVRIIVATLDACINGRGCGRLFDAARAGCAASLRHRPSADTLLDFHFFEPAAVQWATEDTAHFVPATRATPAAGLHALLDGAVILPLLTASACAAAAESPGTLRAGELPAVAYLMTHTRASDAEGVTGSRRFGNLWRLAGMAAAVSAVPERVRASVRDLFGTSAWSTGGPGVEIERDNNSRVPPNATEGVATSVGSHGAAQAKHGDAVACSKGPEKPVCSATCEVLTSLEDVVSFLVARNDFRATLGQQAYSGTDQDLWRIVHDLAFENTLATGAAWTAVFALGQAHATHKNGACDAGISRADLARLCWSCAMAMSRQERARRLSARTTRSYVQNHFGDLAVAPADSSENGFVYWFRVALQGDATRAQLAWSLVERDLSRQRTPIAKTCLMLLRSQPATLKFDLRPHVFSNPMRALGSECRRFALDVAAGALFPAPAMHA